MNAADSIHALVAGFATRVEPCRCDRLAFPHRHDQNCADHAAHLADDAADDRRQQQAEWNADRAQDANAINRGDA
jgi:hypothetical protein